MRSSTASPNDISLEPAEDNESTNAGGVDASPPSLTLWLASAPEYPPAEDAPGGHSEDENSFETFPNNHPQTLTDRPLPAEDMPSSHVEDENPFEALPNNRPQSPMPDFHLQDGNGGPSEPISWAFQRQGLGDLSENDPRGSPVGRFGDSLSPTSPPSAMRDDNIDRTLSRTHEASIDPSLLDPSPRDASLLPTAVNREEIPGIGALSHPSPSGSMLQVEMNPFVFNATLAATLSSTPPTQTSTHPLTAFSSARPAFVYRGFGSLNSSKVASPTVASLATSPDRGRASSIILTSLAKTATTTATSENPDPTPPLAPIPATRGRGGGRGQVRGGRGGRGRKGRGGGVASESTTENATSTDPDLQQVGSMPAAGRGGRGGRGRKGRGGGVASEITTENATSTDPDLQQVGSMSAAGRGSRGGRGRKGRGGGAASTDSELQQVSSLSDAARRRIDILNKRVYAPDGTYHGPPLGASHSINVDGLHPCITFQGPPPAAVPKKRSWDVVSEADIVPGKRARKERVRLN